MLPVSLLAGLGCELDFSSGRKVTSLRLAIFWTIAVLLAGFTLLFAFSDHFANNLLTFYFKNPGPEARTGITRSLFHASAIWLLAALLYHSGRTSWGRWQQAALAGVVAFDLFWAGAAVNHFAPRQFLTGVPELAKTVRAEIGDGRFLRMPNPDRMGFYLPGDDISYMHRWNMETLDNYTAAFYGIPVIFHENFDGVAKKEVARLAEVLHKLTWNQRLPLFSASAIRLVLSPEKLTIPGLRFLAIVRNSSNTDFYLYRCDNCSRNVFVSSWISVRSSEEALQHFMKADFDPARQALIEGVRPSGERNCSTPAVNASYLSDILARYSLQTECPGYLVFSEPFYPGWRICVDGKPADPVKANYAFSAVYLPAGQHQVERDYRSNSLLYGGAVSVLSAVALIIAMKRNRVWLPVLQKI